MIVDIFPTDVPACYSNSHLELATLLGGDSDMAGCTSGVLWSISRGLSLVRSGCL